MITQFEKNHGFKKIGAYHIAPTGAVHRTSLVRLADRKSLVYAMFCNGNCKYIGKTIQGYARPLGYHKNDVMKTVKSGIESALAGGYSVDVYAKEDNLELHHEGLHLNAVEAIEQALITKYQPEWNNFIQVKASSAA